MKYFKTSGAYLLFEVMVAVTIVSISMIAIMQSFSSAVAASKYLRDYMHASILAENKMWEFERKKEAYIGDSSGIFEENDKFKWKAEIKELDQAALQETGQTISGIKEYPSKLNLVTVTVTWIDKNRPKNLTISTYMRASAAKETNIIASEKPAQINM